LSNAEQIAAAWIEGLAARADLPFAVSLREDLRQA
jgi:hypothetical protein